jgi:hypothetical protein
VNTLGPSWTSVPGAADYNVYVKRVSDNFLLRQRLGVKGSSFTFSDAFAAGISYYWTVQGRNYKADKGPMSDKAYFSIEKTEGFYTLTVNRLVANGNGATITDTYNNLRPGKAAKRLPPLPLWRSRMVPARRKASAFSSDGTRAELRT